MSTVEFLDLHRQQYNDWVAVDVVPHFSDWVKQRFLEIAKTFNPNYTEDLNCETCVMNLVDFVYIQSEIAGKNTEESGVVAMTFPKNHEDGEGQE